MMEGIFMSTTNKSDDDLMQQLQEAALETVQLQAGRSMSSEEQRLLANNLINILLGRGLPKEPCLLDPGAPSVGSTLSLREAAEEFLRDHMAAGSRPEDQAFLDVLLEGISTAQPAASTNGAEANRGELRSFSPWEEDLIEQGMRNSGKSRAYIIDELLDFGIL
jgi:hypothetical protein